MSASIYVAVLLLLPRYFANGRYSRFVLVYAILVSLATFAIYIDDRLMLMQTGEVETGADTFYYCCSAAVRVLLLSMVGMGIHGLANWINSTRQISQMREEALRTELALLRTQLNPHFLFNTLNQIFGQIDRSNKTARDMVLRFSDLMRVGSTGGINFTYKGQSVAYKTVRAANGKVWLQQNLGALQVTFNENDFSSYGDYFQWGRWDDGHQTRTSTTVAGSTTLMNPSHITSGNPAFITGATAGTRWWGLGGTASDAWAGTSATSTNGKDPCAALGTGWHMPTAADWQNVSASEDLFGPIAAFQSNLKLNSAGNRAFQNGDVGYYWTNGADNNSNAKVFFFDNTYNSGVTLATRAEGYSCRCVKN